MSVEVILKGEDTKDTTANSIFIRNQYKCCSNCFHVTTGSMIIGVIQSVALAMQVLITMVFFATNGLNGLGPFLTGLIFSIAYSVILICFFTGLKHEHSTLLLPFLAAQLLAIIMLALGFVFALVIASGEIEMIEHWFARPHTHISDHNRREFMHFVLIIAAVLSAIGVLIEIWVFSVVHKCYHYFCQKQNYSQFIVA